jgi:hypothetical protein
MQCNAMHECMYVSVWLFSFWSNFLFHIGLLRADITGFKSNWIPNINNQYTTLGDSIAISMTKTQKPWGCGATYFQTDPFWIWGSVLQILANCYYWKDTLNSGLIPFRFWVFVLASHLEASSNQTCLVQWFGVSWLRAETHRSGQEHETSWNWCFKNMFAVSMIWLLKQMEETGGHYHDVLKFCFMLNLCFQSS